MGDASSSTELLIKFYVTSTTYVGRTGIFPEVKPLQEAVTRCIEQ